jgi:hypothetical protein
MSATGAGTQVGIQTILAYLKTAFPDYIVEVYEDRSVKGHRFVMSRGSRASLAPLIVPTATLSDVRGRLDAGFSARLQRLLLHRDVIGKLQAAAPEDRVIFARAGVIVNRAASEQSGGAPR